MALAERISDQLKLEEETPAEQNLQDDKRPPLTWSTRQSLCPKLPPPTIGMAFQSQHHGIPIWGPQRQSRNPNLQPVGQCLKEHSLKAASPTSETPAGLTLRHTDYQNQRGQSLAEIACFLFVQVPPFLPPSPLSHSCAVEFHVRPSTQMRDYLLSKSFWVVTFHPWRSSSRHWKTTCEEHSQPKLKQLPGSVDSTTVIRLPPAPVLAGPMCSHPGSVPLTNSK